MAEPVKRLDSPIPISDRRLIRSLAYIGGRWKVGKDAAFVPVIDPATGMRMGEIARVDRAGCSLDTDKEPDEQVRLMTLHGSKGLEFPHVFMPGFEEGFLPHKKSVSETFDVDEERRPTVALYAQLLDDSAADPDAALRAIEGHREDEDLLELLRRLGDGPVVLIGHGEESVQRAGGESASVPDHTLPCATS